MSSQGAFISIAEAHTGTITERSYECWTPVPVLEWARAVLGRIDLDPASCAEANHYVGAANYFTAANEGQHQTWYGRVWCNPPYNGGGLRIFARKLLAELETGAVEAAIFLGPVVAGKWTSEMSRAATWIAPLNNQLLHWRGPDEVAGMAVGHTLWGFGCDPNEPLPAEINAVYANCRLPAQQLSLANV